MGNERTEIPAHYTVPGGVEAGLELSADEGCDVFFYLIYLLSLLSD